MSVRVDRPNGMHVLVTYRGMRGPLQAPVGFDLSTFPLVIAGATVLAWEQITTNTLGVTVSIDVTGMDYYYINESPDYLAYGNLPIQGKRGKVR